MHIWITSKYIDDRDWYLMLLQFDKKCSSRKSDIIEMWRNKVAGNALSANTSEDGLRHMPPF